MTIGHKQIGTGSEKVLVLHNWFGDCTSYDAMIPSLDLSHFTYVFMDMRGYGLSKQTQGTYSAQESADDALSLTHKLGWTQFHLIGHSMSGMVAQKMALEAPSRVKSIIAITPVPASGSPKPPPAMDFLTQAASSDSEKAIQCIHMLTRHQYTDTIAKKMVEMWYACSTPEARVAYLHMFSDTDFSKAAQGLQTPMLVVYGENDFEGEEAHMRSTFLQWYPNAKLVCCKSAGHFPMQETPLQLATLIEKFIKDL